MTTTLDGLEGRLIAQRQILARLIQAHGDTLTGWLRDKSVVEIPDEDPGMGDASPAFAIEANLAEEMRQILDIVERLNRENASGADRC
ncbi:hypothetical protein [Loktanella sp. M215]|uniref:hypothetical protein n=1 Tax=Loktanella sp. M215 TaxID=2675431 RepID=UPI001F25D030|nr:hypothetical protein [Loktanella sp. M215]MCF7701760.1 hypothetical protein [Loktanella sp. M215]